MAIYDVVRFESPNINWLICKHEADEFNTRSKLIVSPGQIAILVHNGKIEKILGEGTYRLDTELLPFVKAFVKGVFGGKNPYPMEVYFINKTLKLDMLWGTTDPIALIDPSYGIQIRLRARGQLGVRLENYQYFFQTLVGTLMKSNYITFDILQNYFRGIINQRVKKVLSSYIIDNKISYFEIDPHIDDIQTKVQEPLVEDFKKFGFDLVNLSIESINVPNEDLTKLNEILHKKAEYEQLGDNFYRTSRGYDVLEAGAKNNSAAGSILGVGIGMNVGNSMNGGVGSIIPPSGSSSPMAASLKCSNCSAPLDANDKFCSNCGQKVVTDCPKCGQKLEVGDKFCSNCGEKVY